jgi:hypothetical protein
MFNVRSYIANEMIPWLLIHGFRMCVYYHCSLGAFTDS